MKTYLKKYDLLKQVDLPSWEDIEKKVEKTLIEIKKCWFKENLNNTNEFLWDDQAKFWFTVEHLVWQLDDKIEMKNDEKGEKYDYTTIRNWRKVYVDIKWFKIAKGKEIDEIIDKKYKSFLQFEQVSLTYHYCIKNNIDIKDFYFEIVWWDGNKEWNLIRCLNDNLRLDNIITKLTPKYQNPFWTNWNEEQVLNYIVDLIQYNKDNNIVL